MSATPQAKNTDTATLSPQELELLERYAKAHGMTIEQAATAAVSQALAARYVTNKRINNIVRFPK
jgi:hypothetical protein